MTPPAAGATNSLDRQVRSNPRRVSARTARRVSGPARPRARASTGSSRSAAAVALPAPIIAPPTRRPMRTGAPAHRRAESAAARHPGIALRTAGALERVSAGTLLDRLIRGRVWIGLLAFALIGIVAMQLVVLKLNTGIGGKLQREALLQRENAELGIENSVYSAENRIAPLAAASGMTFAPAGTVHFVTASPDDLSRAASALTSAAQSSTATQPEATQTPAGEAGATPQSTAASGETEATGSSTTAAEGADGSSEAAPAGSAESGSAASTAAASAATQSETASAPATTQASSAGEQTSGASTGPAGGASALTGGAQAGPRG
jgi:hypothetical protein